MRPLSDFDGQTHLVDPNDCNSRVSEIHTESFLEHGFTSSDTVAVCADGQWHIVRLQPKGDDLYISEEKGTVTRFELAQAVRRNKGGWHLIHSDIGSEELVNQHQVGDVCYVLLGDGSLKKATMAEKWQFEAVEPNNPYSDFKNVESQAQFPSTVLFAAVGMSKYDAVLQTCDEIEGDPQGKRTFAFLEYVDQ